MMAPLPGGFTEPRKPEQQPTEANRQSEYHKRKHGVNDHYSNVAGERERKG